jgi:prefoldin subunit 5
MDIKQETVAVLLIAGCIVAGCAASPPATDFLERRLSALEEKLNVWPKERASLSNRIVQTDRTATAGVRRARAETTALVESLRREVNRTVEPMQSRLAAVETAERDLQEEIAALRRELEELRAEAR